MTASTPASAPALTLDNAFGTPLASPLDGVSNAAWTEFINAMITAPTSAVSPSNALGAFEITPRRLADLGLFADLKRTISKKSGRTIWVTSRGEDHLRARKFLKSLSLQYQVLIQSFKNYCFKFSSGAVKLPAGCTLSGSLALLHRAGLAGLTGKRFPATQALFEKTNGIF